MIYAQTETEILNYSRLSYAGSARAAAMGGAFGALGGDISSWNLNPAAVGVFRKSTSQDACTSQSYNRHIHNPHPTSRVAPTQVPNKETLSRESVH